jgi:hypothetical protein
MWSLPVVIDDISVTTTAHLFARLENWALLRLEDVLARIGFLSLSATGYSMALAKATQERGHERVFFNVVDRERAITERGLSFVLYGLEEYPAGSLAGIFEKTGRLIGVQGFQYFIERMLTQVIDKVQHRSFPSTSLRWSRCVRRLPRSSPILPSKDDSRGDRYSEAGALLAMQ